MGLRDRLESIKDINGAMLLAGINVRNTALEITKIVNAGDEPTVLLIEGKAIENSQRFQRIKTRQSKQSRGVARESFCRGVLGLIDGINMDRGLSTSDEDSFDTEFTQVYSRLRNRKPGRAKTLIEAIAPDGSIVTQEIIDMILEEFQDKGF